MMIESNKQYKTVFGEFTVNSPKFTKSTIRNIYAIRRWMFEECFRLNTDMMNKHDFPINCQYDYNLTLLKGLPKEVKKYSYSDINFLSNMLFGDSPC